MALEHPLHIPIAADCPSLAHQITIHFEEITPTG